jgi:RHS repeat-associated protein
MVMKSRALNIGCLMLVILLVAIVSPYQVLALISSSVNAANTTALDIPDTGAWVYSNINISGAPSNAKITGIDIHFSTTHPRSSDLDIQLSSPYTSGVHHLWTNEGGTAPNPSKTVTGVTTFNGLKANGNWNLYLRDTVSGNSGNLVEWWITIYYTSENGTGYSTYSTDSSILAPLIVGTDENSDGNMETFQFLIRNDYKAPDGIRVAPKIISNTTGQAWGTGYTNLSNSSDIIYLDDTWFTLSKNTDLTFTVELWNSTRTTLLASNQVNGGPVKAGVYYYVYGAANNWVPGTDVDGDGYYETYSFQIGVDGDISAGPDDVTAKVICTTTGQSWWASAPWTITGVTPDYHYFNFDETDFSGHISSKKTLNFVVELWNAAKTTKLGTATFDSSMLKVEGEPCSIAVNTFSSSNSPFDPYTGGSTTFSAGITAYPSAHWELSIDGNVFANGDTIPVSNPWFGKNSLGRLLDPGTYTVTLVAKDPSEECSDSKTVVVKIDKKSVPTSDCLDVNCGSSTNVSTGDLSHSQELFSLKGGALATSIELFYNSLNSYSGPLGPGWSHTYDISLTENPDGSVLLREGSGGKSLYTKSGSSYIPPLGDFSALVKNGDGTYAITYLDGHKYNFSQIGKITSISDRFNNTVILTYTNGDLTGITDPAQRLTVLGYDTGFNPHRINSITDPNLKIYNFSYQVDKLTVTNPAADPNVSTVRGYWEYQYNTDGYLQSKRDPNGNLTQYTYYDDHRLEKSIDPEGITVPANHTRTLIYPTTSDSPRTTTLIEKDNGIWHYTYDALAGVLKKKTSPNGTFLSYTYYPNGYLKSATEPKDDTIRLTTFYTYDVHGNVLTETEPADLSVYSPPYNDPETISDPAALASLSPPIKTAIRYGYDTDNYDRITSVSDERVTPALTTTYVYSTENEGEVVTATATPGNYVTVTKKNQNGMIKEIIDANLKSTTFTYYPDTADYRAAGIVGLLWTVTDPAGITTTVTAYDKVGNPLEMTTKDSAGAVRLTTTQQHDALNRLKQLTKTAVALPNIITKYGYDFIRNPTSVIDAETRETRYEYNYNRRVKKISDAKQNDTIFKYSGSEGNGVDKLIGVYDATVTKNTPLDSQPHTAFSYDKLGRLEYETDQLSKKMHYTYYDNGLIKEKYDASTATPGTLLATYLYNNRGQVTDKNFTGGTSEHFEYYPDGKLRTASNQNISYSYVYYDDGRLHTVTDTTNNRVISYDLYDGLGQRKQVTILKGAGTDERVISYDYDSANRPWHITSGAGIFTYAYDNLGRRDTITYPNGTFVDWNFDYLSRLTAITHKVTGGAPFAAFSYTDYDKTGNYKSISGNKNETYLYDELYHLLTVTSTRPESFIYDAVGNRQNGPNAEDSVYVHNYANQMTAGRKLGYGYDNFGNQTTKTVPGATDKSWVHAWDYQNRLVKVEKTKGSEKRTVTFTYDPFGRRIGKQLVITRDGTQATTKTFIWSYVYDGDDIALEIYTPPSGPQEKTFYTHGPGIDEHLAMERDGSNYYYHADILNSIIAVTGQNGQVKMFFDYDSYGMIKPTEYDANGIAKSAVTFRNTYTYTGREWDKETGLYYYRARYYDPLEGRFISKDPIGFAGGDVNLYGYVSNNPVNAIDPTGYSTWINGNGYVQHVIADSDLSIYATVDGRTGPIGKTLFWDSFVSPDTHKPVGQVIVGQSIDNYMAALASKASKMSEDAAFMNALPGKEFDIKSVCPGHEGKSYHGFLFKGNYVSLREAGNILAGIIAASHGLSFEHFQKGAGALNAGGISGAVGYRVFGITYGNAPNWGESNYQRTRSLYGYNLRFP